MELYEVYLRMQDGDTYYPEDIREGIKQFLGNNGYRISFNIEGVVVTLRRDTQVSADMVVLDNHPHAQSIDCVATIRGHK